jgi:hypothetical protein
VEDYAEMGTSVLDRVEVLEEMLWRVMRRRGRLCVIVGRVTERLLCWRKAAERV